jgi:hypothetical protein
MVVDMGSEWQQQERPKRASDEAREYSMTHGWSRRTLWLRPLDWFNAEPGLWVGDATEGFLASVATCVARFDRGKRGYLSKPRFSSGLFLSPRQLRPRLVVKGKWHRLARRFPPRKWEQESLKL